MNHVMEQTARHPRQPFWRSFDRSLWRQPGRCHRRCHYRVRLAIGLVIIALARLGSDALACAEQPPAASNAAAAPSSRQGDETPAKRATGLLGQSRPAGDIQYASQLVQTAREVGRDGDLETAQRLLLAALEHYLADTSADHQPAIFTVRMAIVSAAWQRSDHELVVAQSESLLKLPTGGNDSNARIGVRQMLAKSLNLTGRHSQSLEVTRQLAEASAVARSLAAEHSLVIGAAALRAGQPQVATDAYQLYLTVIPDGARRADAELGIAWAAVSGAQAAEQAEQLLSQFISNHPDHGDVSHAIVAQAGVLDRLGQTEEATQLRFAVLAKYPDSTAANQVLDALISALPAPWPDSLRARWRKRLETITPKSPNLPAAIYENLLAGSLASSDDPLWQSTVAAMVTSDSDGNLTSEVLDRLSAVDAGGAAGSSAPQVHVAEHLAIDLMGRLIDLAKATDGPTDQIGQPIGTPGRSVPAACESACRWAGTSGRWSMLAMLAEDLAVPDRERGLTMRRGAAIDRMVAESLMQTHRGGEALPWWLAIIDAWRCDDFPTLIRAAETAVAFAAIDVAHQRLEAAKLAAGEDGFKVSLTRMLEAELAIRRARLDEARDLLAVIVRASETTAELRPRAQWLIGETYFLQQKYAEAIDAYRRVDTLDASGQWAALALLQAGKAFEKLARPREAATCYTALLTRFADLPHANHARTRLAQIGSDAPLRR